MERVINSNPLRASNGRTATLIKGTYAAGVAAIIAAIWASPSYAQTPGSEMMGQMQTAVLALLATGAAIVLAVAVFFAAKALLSRVRS